MSGTTERRMSLFYRDIEVGGKSDKVYTVEIVSVGTKATPAYQVKYLFGPRGGWVQSGFKTKNAVTLTEANATFDEVVAHQIEKKGYRPEAEYACAGPTLAAVEPKDAKSTTRYACEQPQDATREESDALIKNSKFWLQQKMDGVRRQIHKTPAGAFIGYNKLGKAVELPTSMLAELMAIPAKSFWMDGELVGDKYWAFDLFELNGDVVAQEAYSTRFTRLTQLLGMGENVCIVPTAVSIAAKTAAMAGHVQLRHEGVVFKRTDVKYRAGDSGQHKRFKFVKSVSCYVTSLSTKKASATVSMLDGARWIEVSDVSTNGKGTIAKGDVVEVLFLYATAGRRLYQPRIKEVRTDVEAADCTIDQLAGKFKEGIAEAA